MSDSYCSLTGGSYYYNESYIIKSIVGIVWDYLPTSTFKPSKSLLERLTYTKEDVEGSQDLVLLTPKKENGDLDVGRYNGPTFEPTVPATFSKTTVAAVVNFTIGNNPDLGDFKIIFPNSPALSVSMFPNYNKFFISLSSYRILIGCFPELKPHVIYAALMRTVGCVEESAMIGKQYAYWPDVTQFDDIVVPDKYAQMGQAEYFWFDLLTDEKKSEDEIVREAWFGKGRLYYFSRADNFPKSRPFATFPRGLDASDNTFFSRLPFDVLDYLYATYLTIRDACSLLCLNHSLRAMLLPFINAIAKKTISRYHPYWLPIVAPCPRGDEEQKRWENMWTGFEGQVPWAAYARDCTKSPGMRNRERIWRMARRFRNNVKEAGWLDGRIS